MTPRAYNKRVPCDAVLVLDNGQTVACTMGKGHRLNNGDHRTTTYATRREAGAELIIQTSYRWPANVLEESK